jgi:hypothetical protein
MLGSACYLCLAALLVENLCPVSAQVIPKSFVVLSGAPHLDESMSDTVRRQNALDLSPQYYKTQKSRHAILVTENSSRFQVEIKGAFL